MHAQRRHRRPQRRSRFRSFWLITQISALVILAAVLGVIVAAFFSVSKMVPVGSGIADYQPTEATRIYSSDGVLLASLYEENREFVSIDKIPADLQNATVAIEDSRFYKHMGIDFVGIARAFYQDLRRGHMAQGGSTLTQQLARNIYLTRQKKISRKLQEMVLAYEIERNYSKQQILELYLNQVYYGSGAYGVQTAAKTYFGKDVKDLTLAECALIAGLPQKPSGYSPYRDMKAAVDRRNIVLNRMCELHYITQKQCDEATRESVHLVGLKPIGPNRFKAPWFVNYVLDQLADKYKYDEDMIYKGGLKVYTTLNYGMEKAAEEELRSHVRDARSRNVSQGALVCIDPNTGYIKAMVGGVSTDYSKDQYNRAVQARRQPGSSFKAFVYTAAIDNGYDPNYRISNSRISFPIAGGHTWSPKNFDGRYGGTRTIKQAVAQSINVCAVRMADKIGIDKVITYARMLGIKSPLTPNLTLALGSCGVTPLEICSAYGVFAADGIRAEPMAIVRVTTSPSLGGQESVLIDNKPTTRRVLSEETADMMNEIFRGVVTSRGGTGYAARKVPNAHGKTGTTSDDRDAWFVGYTPELVTAVWVGNDDYRQKMRDVWGGNVCAPTWANFMLKALKLRKEEQASEATKSGQDSTAVSDIPNTAGSPDRTKTSDSQDERTVTICAQSGMLATPYCPTTYKMKIKSNVHLKTCNIHGPNATTDQSDQTGDTGQNAQGGQDTGYPNNYTAPPAPDQSPTPESQHSRTAAASEGKDHDKYVTLTICVDSGLIANEYCPQTIRKRFLASEAPTKVCTLHKPPQ